VDQTGNMLELGERRFENRDIPVGSRWYRVDVLGVKAEPFGTLIVNGSNSVCLDQISVGAMAASLALATLLGVVLGYQYRVAALILVLAGLVIGGALAGLSPLQICAAALMVQVGYIVCSAIIVVRPFLRTRITAKQEEQHPPY
jgi:hypothetical protein